MIALGAAYGILFGGYCLMLHWLLGSLFLVLGLLCTYALIRYPENRRKPTFVKSLCMFCKQLILAICLCITGGLSSLWGQSQYVPLNTSTYDVINRLDIKYGRMIDQFHTSQKPYTRRSIATLSAELENLRNRDLRLDFDLDYLIKATRLAGFTTHNPWPPS